MKCPICPKGIPRERGEKIAKAFQRDDPSHIEMIKKKWKRSFRLGIPKETFRTSERNTGKYPTI